MTHTRRSRPLIDAIDAVHNHPQQIIHRDIKPTNLLIRQDDGRLLLADFGIARAMQKEPALTQRGWAADPQKLARLLVDAANLAGGDGNSSAIVIHVQ